MLKRSPLPVMGKNNKVLEQNTKKIAMPQAPRLSSEPAHPACGPHPMNQTFQPEEYQR